MIEKQTAKRLVALVSNTDMYTLLQEYVIVQIETLHKEMETCSNDLFPVYRGRIQELRNIQKLREQVLQDSKRN